MHQEHLQTINPEDRSLHSFREKVHLWHPADVQRSVWSRSATAVSGWDGNSRWRNGYVKLGVRDRQLPTATVSKF